jgi:carbonic anhydrase
VMVDAWAKGQKVRLHGWAFGVNDGLLHDLGMTVDSTEAIEPVYRQAIAAALARRK